MRLALLGLLGLGLAGCIIEPQDDDPYYDDYNTGSGSGTSGGGGWGSGSGGGGGSVGYGCRSDAECGGGLTCTRSGECLSPSLVRAVRTIWTLDGVAASTTSCTNVPHLSITFSTSTVSGGEEFGYTPVPCNAGKFTVDKFPTRFTHVRLSRAYDYAGGAYGMFASDGTAMLDLPY